VSQEFFKGSSLNSKHRKPGPVGGRLIRKVIGALRAQVQAAVPGSDLPIDSHILIATSGGLDSVALAHLLATYGHRVAPKSKISLLHINHGWRGEASDADQAWVERLGEGLGVRVVSRSLKDKLPRAGESWEERARQGRKTIFEELGRELGADHWILTAHHADDQAETLLWRLLTGAGDTHGAGILPREGRELRPCLSIRKADLRAYLLEEGQEWREDSTNHEGRLLRSRIRQELMPVVEKLFPKAVEHLGDLAEKAGKAVSHEMPLDNAQQQLANVLGSKGIRLKRVHLQAVSDDQNSQELDLPGGWRLVRAPHKKSRSTLQS